MKSFIALSAIAILSMSVAASSKPKAEIVPGFYPAKALSSIEKKDSGMHHPENALDARTTSCHFVCDYLPGLPVENCVCTYSGDENCCNPSSYSSKC